MVTIRRERTADQVAREQLLDAAYGPIRFSKPSHKLREGRDPADGLSFVATDGDRVVGTVRLWTVSAGPNRTALLLGPLAVDPQSRNRGIGSALMQHALRAAQRRGHDAVLLVGDPSYYGRFGFSAAKTTGLWLNGVHDKHRLLGLEFAAGALDGVRGLIRVPRQTPSRLAPLVAAMARRNGAPQPA